MDLEQRYEIFLWTKGGPGSGPHKGMRRLSPEQHAAFFHSQSPSSITSRFYGHRSKESLTQYAHDSAAKGAIVHAHETHDGKVVGISEFHPFGTRHAEFAVMVDSSHQGQGHAKHIIKDALSHIKTHHNITHVETYGEVKNKPLIHSMLHYAHRTEREGSTMVFHTDLK